MPLSDKPGIVSYQRGGITEKYLTKANSVEQQFVIPEPLSLNGQELVIEGKVESSGAFESTRGGWLWRNKDGVVSLGDVYAYDAAGNELPATMKVTSDSTRIVGKWCRPVRGGLSCNDRSGDRHKRPPY